VSATGNYTFNGSFTVGVVDKTWTVKGPIDFSTETNMMKTADGISTRRGRPGSGGRGQSHRGHRRPRFAAGPYFRVTSASVFSKVPAPA